MNPKWNVYLYEGTRRRRIATVRAVEYKEAREIVAKKRCLEAGDLSVDRVEERHKVMCVGCGWKFMSSQDPADAECAVCAQLKVVSARASDLDRATKKLARLRAARAAQKAKRKKA